MRAAQGATFGAAVFLAALVLPSFSRAKDGPDAKSRTAISIDAKLDAVSAWVLKTGKADEIDENLSPMMGLPSGSRAPGVGRGYGGPDQGTGVYFVVLRNRAAIVLVRKEFQLNRGYYWPIENGLLTMMIVNVNHELKIVTSEGLRKAGIDVVNYFYDRLPSQGVAPGATRS